MAAHGFSPVRTRATTPCVVGAGNDGWATGSGPVSGRPADGAGGLLDPPHPANPVSRKAAANETAGPVRKRTMRLRLETAPPVRLAESCSFRNHRCDPPPR